MKVEFAPQSLQHLITERSLTRTQLAKRMGVSRITLGRILNGEFQPSAKVLTALKDVFPEVSLDYYFKESGA